MGFMPSQDKAEIMTSKEVFYMSFRKDAPIGVFDSGVGGLTVAREIMRNLPHEKIVYFGDTARVPYGRNPRRRLSVIPGRLSAFYRLRR